MLIGQAKEQVPLFVKNNKIGGVICDFCPLRVPANWVTEVKKSLPDEIPFAQVFKKKDIFLNEQLLTR